MNLTIFLFISTYRKLFHFLVFDSIHNHYRSNLTIWWLFPHCCTFGTLSFFAIPTHSQNTAENCSSRPEHSEHSEMLAGLRSPHDWEFQQRRPETRGSHRGRQDQKCAPWDNTQSPISSDFPRFWFYSEEDITLYIIHIHKIMTR